MAAVRMVRLELIAELLMRRERVYADRTNIYEVFDEDELQRRFRSRGHRVPRRGPAATINVHESRSRRTVRCLEPTASSAAPTLQCLGRLHLCGDEAFQLNPDFLRPYRGRYLEEDLRLFNYRLRRAR
ncbi:hypothetical protein HPB49_025038 [Dermacentor silvarum]|uniref:Uncharacterized protein n=1 Tax=Dermacentor silvarum TaxID=543639 RepID=A0ACB8CNR8_DERSI|nr:hypothetical protein HPB49_025038 [Dermacentor silvarum]